MATVIINQFNTSNSATPSLTDLPIATTSQITIQKGKDFSDACEVQKTVTVLQIYNHSLNETVLVSALNDDLRIEPVPPMSLRYIPTYVGAMVRVKSI